MTGLWAWCFIASVLVTSDAQQLDGPIIMSPSEILLQKGENYSIHCKGRRPLEFKIQEAGEEDDGNFEKILIRNVAPSDNNYKYEISLELRNVDRFAVGYYACHDDLIDAEELFKELTEEPSNTEHISYTYVYVNDTENLIAPMREIVYVTKHASKTVIECKPTFPDIQVNLSMEFIVSEYNPKLGYILDSTNSLDLEPMTELICEFERNGLRDETNVYLDISTSMNMEKPKIFPKQPFFLEHDTIFLNCTMKYTANTAIILNWKIPRDSSQVEFYSNENQIQNDLYKAIRVRNAKKTDAGKYICEAEKGDIEKTNDSVNMKFLDEPFLKLSLASDKEITTIFKTSEITFLFILDGYPFPTYQYFKDGNKSIINGTKYSFKTTTSRKYPQLLINNLDIFDTGNYTIEAKNAYRTERETVRLYVRDIPRITFNLSGRRKLKGQKVNIVCEVTGFPLPDVVWTFIDDKTNKAINEPGKLEKVSDYKVVSTLDLLVQSSGTIICKASNTAEGDVKKTYESIGRLLVEEIDGGFGIENGEKKYKDVSEKDSITLRCLASTYDFMSVDWIPPNGVELPDNSVEQSNNTMSRIATLQIHDVSLSQSGEYTCVGYDNITNVERRATIFIRVAGIRVPTIKFPALDTAQEVMPYQHVTLTCTAEAIPPPEITWLKDGKVLDEVESSNVKASSLDHGTVNSTYTFQQNGTDNLIYECVARSGSHEVSKQYHISIKMPKMPFKAEYIAIIGAIIVALILLVLYLTWKIKKEKQFRKELAAAGLLYFKEGAPRSLNPELGIDEQAELLPYDEKFEFPSEKLILGPQLGAGAFGVVYKAEARGIINAEDVTTVAVKMVKKTADNIYIKALASELKIMVHLGKHVNIVNLLGACTKNVGKRELVVIVEFCKFGNIHNYMQRHRDVFIDQLTDNKEKSQGNVNRGFSCSGVDSGMTSDCLNTNQTQQTDHTFLNTAASNRSGRLDKPNPNSESVKVSGTGYVQPEWRSNYVSDYVYEGRKPRPLTSRDLLAWAFQIARGMEYLASMKILHGDLAARNILLAEDNVVKICDFGLARSIYKNDEYQKKENSPLPVKWLAVECMTDRIFSTQSDVWSFGIVLWELFSLAKTPYPEINPQDLLRRLQEGHRLSKPPYADDRLYRVMRACWEQRPPKRPTFTELQETIGSFLEDSVRNHYVDLNQPCAKTNAVRAGENYLVQVCAPDYNHQVTPSPHHYANDANGFFFGVTPKPPAIQLQHDDEGYLAMTPASQNVYSPRMGSAFDFDARVLNGRGSAASQNSELTPMLTLNHLSARSGSESDHDGNTSPYLNMHPRIDEETDEVFETETKMNNLKNSQNNAVTNPTYITFPSIDKKSPIVSNNYVNVNGNGLVK